MERSGEEEEKMGNGGEVNEATHAKQRGESLERDRHSARWARYVERAENGMQTSRQSKRPRAAAGHC